MSKYRVEIVSIKDLSDITVVGKGLSESQADKREVTAMSRINEGYFVRIVEETE